MFGATSGTMGVLFVGVIVAGIYAVFGWIFTAIACLIYNFIAGFTGGIEFQLEVVPPPAAVPGHDLDPAPAQLPHPLLRHPSLRRRVSRPLRLNPRPLADGQ